MNYSFTLRARLSSWGRRAHGDCCSWPGVICHPTSGHVIKLKLRNSSPPPDYPPAYDDSASPQQVREINSSLLALTELKYLDLSSHDFHGVLFPQFIGAFKELRYLNLSSSHFTGGIPPQIGNLSRLRYLDLQLALDSHVDTLDWLTQFSSLQHLDLSGLDLALTNVTTTLSGSLKVLRMSDCGINSFPISSSVAYNFTSLIIFDLSGNPCLISVLPEWLWNLSSLAHLDLSLCAFRGRIPDAIGDLSSLTVLDLSFNRNLDGSIPGSMAQLRRLEELSLGGNQLTGNFPSWIQQLTSLTTLDLHENLLHGFIPGSLGMLCNLTELYLSGNSFQGALSLVHLDNLTKLEVLDLSFNSLNISVHEDWNPPFQLKIAGFGSCGLGPSFPPWLQHQTRIIFLDLSDNEIAGVLPDWVWNISHFTIDYLELSDNNIQGKLPKFPEHTNLNMLRLAHNLLEGPLPDKLPVELSSLVLDGNYFSGRLPVWPYVGSVSLYNNNFSGAISSSVCQWTMLSFLDLSSNEFSGEIPHCLGESLDGLENLNLDSNLLSGEIPTTIGFLTSLRILRLSNNGLSGGIPPSLQNCSKLVLLDLSNNKFSGSIPTWLGEELSSLAFLVLGSNHFSGYIPQQLAHSGKLQMLDLTHNKLSGTIPPNIGNFSAMASTSQVRNEELEYIEVDLETKGQNLGYLFFSDLIRSIDLSCNSLVGEIPEGVGYLAGVRNLNLSMNHLNGSIPQEIGSMESLESLDLSNNELSGNIPETLPSLHFLSHLNLSYNNLSGRIPFLQQLQSLDDPSIYAGNPGLCGPPISKLCSNTMVNQSGEPHETKAHQEGSEWLWIWISIMLGLVMGFWTFCGILFFNKKWRYGYFHMVDSLYDRVLLRFELLLAHLRRRD
ncbi:receptor-like protein EIX2 [Curcuma longa]|uniref:receptor-like protein EIX2 n=1 Tax=Curcuma longa TaxID=136217 RepID=UPI003D9FAAC1